MSIGGVGGERLAEILQGIQTGQPEAPKGTSALKNVPHQKDSLRKHSGQKNSENLGASTPNLPKPNKQVINELKGEEVDPLADLKDLATKLGIGDLNLELQEAALLEALFENFELQLQAGSAPFPATVAEQMINALELYQRVKSVVIEAESATKSSQANLPQFKAEVAALLKVSSSSAQIRADITSILTPAKQAFSLSGGKENLTLFAATLTRITDTELLDGLTDAAPTLFNNPEYGALGKVAVGAFIIAVAAGSVLALDTFSEYLLIFPLAAAATGADKIAEEKDFKEIGTDLLVNLFITLAEAKQLPSLEEGENKEATSILSRLMEELIAKVVNAIVDAMVKTVKILSKMTEEYMQAKELQDEELQNQILQESIEQAAISAIALAFEVMQLITETLKAGTLVDQKIEPLYRFSEKTTEETAAFTDKHLLNAAKKFVPNFNAQVEKVVDKHIECAQKAFKDVDALPMHLNELLYSQQDLLRAFGKLVDFEGGEQKQLVKELTDFIHALFRNTHGVAETTETEKAA